MSTLTLGFNCIRMETSELLESALDQHEARGSFSAGRAGRIAALGGGRLSGTAGSEPGTGAALLVWRLGIADQLRGRVVIGNSETKPH